MMDGGFNPPAGEDAAAPHNLDAEQAFLGALLYDNAVLDQVSDWLREDHFYDPVHGRIYAEAARRIAAGGVADAVTMKTWAAEDAGVRNLARPGEHPGLYLVELMREAPDASSAPEYARLVRELAMRRALIGIAEETARGARQGEASDDLIERVETDLSELAGATAKSCEVSAGDAFDLAMSELDNPTLRVPTRMHALEERLGGWRQSCVYIVAARSSMGKSAFGIEAAWRVADAGAASAIVSLEMSRQDVAARIAGSVTGIQYRRIVEGRVDMEEREMLAGARERIASTPLTIMDAPGISVAGLRSSLRRWKRARIAQGRDIGVAVIDYLQLIRVESAESLYERISSISRALKPLAGELEMPLIVLAQLNRASESEKNKRPAISNLRDSGAIEEDADAVLLLYRDAYYADREEPKADPNEEHERKIRASSYELEIDVGKNRQGAIGRVSLWCDVRTNQFKEWR